jgi:hypothetical protein
MMIPTKYSLFAASPKDLPNLDAYTCLDSVSRFIHKSSYDDPKNYSLFAAPLKVLSKLDAYTYLDSFIGFLKSLQIHFNRQRNGCSPTTTIIQSAGLLQTPPLPAPPDSLSNYCLSSAPPN